MYSIQVNQNTASLRFEQFSKFNITDHQSIGYLLIAWQGHMMRLFVLHELNFSFLSRTF